MMYSQAQLGALRAALLDIIANGPGREGFGLCYNLTYHPHIDAYNYQIEGENPPHLDGDEFVEAEAQDWPHARKNEHGKLLDWFVPRNPLQGIWEGDNLKMRQNLIQYLLGRVAHHESLLRGGIALAD